MSHRLFVVLMLLVTLIPLEAQVRVVCWNVENFFDTADDPNTADDAFTPDGDNHWSGWRFDAKRDAIYKTLSAMDYPAVVALEEVENSRVLEELCLGTPLRRIGYCYVHYDSPDPRGIDCALLFRTDRVRVLESRAVGVSDSLFRTRDVLLVVGCLSGGDTLILLVNHWPSRLGGTFSDNYRRHVACRVAAVADSLHAVHPGACLLALGDFNATPADSVMTPLYQAGLQSLMKEMPVEPASYKYQGRWQYIDQMLMLAPVGNADLATRCGPHVFAAEWLLTTDNRYMGEMPLRCYRAMVYVGGVSDHLPLYIDLPLR